MIEVWGVLPGEFMGAVFSMLTPIRSMTKYNLDLLEVVDNEAKLINYPEHLRSGRSHHPTSDLTCTPGQSGHR